MKNKITYPKLILLIILVVFIFSCRNDRESNITIVKEYYTFINTGDTTSVIKIIDENFTKINNGNENDIIGPQSVVKAIESHLKNNSEYIFSIVDIFSSNEKVCVRWEWKSINITKQEPKEIKIGGIAIFQIRDKKLYRMWQSFDLQDFFIQLNS